MSLLESIDELLVIATLHVYKGDGSMDMEETTRAVRVPVRGHSFPDALDFLVKNGVTVFAFERWFEDPYEMLQRISEYVTEPSLANDVHDAILDMTSYFSNLFKIQDQDLGLLGPGRTKIVYLHLTDDEDYQEDAADLLIQHVLAIFRRDSPQYAAEFAGL